MPIDYNRYPANWKDIVAQVAERSGNRCEGDVTTGFEGDGRCNAKNGAQVYRLKMGRWRYTSSPASETPAHLVWQDIYDRPIIIVLTVAHLDHDEENPNPPLDRLRHLCQRCHFRCDSDDNRRRRAASKLREEIEAGQAILFPDPSFCTCASLAVHGEPAVFLNPSCPLHGEHSS